MAIYTNNLSRRGIISALALTPAVIAMPALGQPSPNAAILSAWDVSDWAHRWTATGGSMMLHGDDLQIVWRPEDQDKLVPLMREFQAHPHASEAAKQFMRDRGLDGYAFGVPGAGGKAAGA